MKTDAQIQEDVIAELKWEPAVDAAQIGVEVNGGIVTLAGHVTNYAGKWNAEHAAQRVYGVKALVVEIDVTRAGFGFSDTGIRWILACRQHNRRYGIHEEAKT